MDAAVQLARLAVDIRPGVVAIDDRIVIATASKRNGSPELAVVGRKRHIGRWCTHARELARHLVEPMLAREVSFTIGTRPPDR